MSSSGWISTAWLNTIASVFGILSLETVTLILVRLILFYDVVNVHAYRL